MPNVNINTGGGGSVYNPYADSQATGTGSPDGTATEAPTKALAADTLTSAGGTQTLQQATQTVEAGAPKPYLAPADRPTLSQPQNPDAVFSTNPKTGQAQLNSTITSTPILTESDEKNISFDENFNNLLAAATTDQNLSSEDVALVKYAYYHPESDLVPQNLKDLAKSIIQNAADQVQKQFEDPSYQPQPDAASFDKTVSALYQQDFNAALKQYAEDNGLSDEDVARLIFAQNHPDAAVDPKDADILKQVNQQVLSDLNEEYGLPSSLKFSPDTAYFDAQISEDYGTNFDSLLSAYADANGLSSEDAATVKYAFVHPEADIPTTEGGPDFKQIAAELGKQALAQTAKADGLPAGYSPSPPVKTFDQMVTGGFLFAVRDAISSGAYSSLSAEDLNTVFQLVTGQLDLNDPNIPDALKQIARDIKKQALAKVLQQYGIPAGQFEPQPSDLAGASLAVPQNLKVMNGAVGLSTGLTGGLKEIVKSMPDGSSKSIYADYLKAISDAIADLRNVLYLIQQKDSSLSKDMSNWSLEGARNKNDLNTASRNEQLKKMRDRPKPKGGVLGAIMKVFAKLGPILSIIMATVMMGPVGLALAVLDAKLQIFSKMTNGIAGAIGKIAAACGASEKTVKGIETAMKVMVIAAFFMALGPMAGSGFIVFGPQMIQESGVCEDIAVSCGADPELAQKIGMYLTMAIGITIALATMLVPIPGPQLAGIASGAANALRSAATAMGEISTTASKILTNLASAIEKIPTLSLSGSLSKIGSQAKSFMGSALDKFSDTVGALSKAVKFPEEASAALGKVADNMQSLIDGVRKSLADLSSKLPNMDGTVMEKVIDKLEGFINSAWDEAVSTATDPIALASTIESGANIQSGITSFKVAEWLKLKGKIEELIAQIEATLEVLEAALKNLRTVIDNLFSGMPQTGQQINDLNTLVLTLYQKADESQTKLFNAIPG